MLPAQLLVAHWTEKIGSGDLRDIRPVKYKDMSPI